MIPINPKLIAMKALRRAALFTQDTKSDETNDQKLCNWDNERKVHLRRQRQRRVPMTVHHAEQHKFCSFHEIVGLKIHIAVNPIDEIDGLESRVNNSFSLQPDGS